MSISAGKKLQHRVNRKITAPEVRVIAGDGSQIGVVSNEEAQKIAEEASMDLVEIAPQAEPPVCRIMDYGRYRFEEQKKRQLARKKQKQIHIKEVKFRPNTDVGDYQVKLRNLVRFLSDGDKVKVTLRFRGREMAHQDLGRKLLQRVEEDLQDHGTIEQYPKMEGRLMVMVLSPKKKK